MKASHANKITCAAVEDGMDPFMDQCYRKIRSAAKTGFFETKIPIIPWYNFNDKHVELLVNKGYKVEVGRDHVYISWEGVF